MLNLHGGIYSFIAELDFGVLGYAIVALFLLAWACSVAYWKFGRLEERFGRQPGPHSHAHTHANGAPHTHQHLHPSAHDPIGLQ
jgi:high-affinity nickel-transport protein